MKEFDTICAIATPIGEGGVAIIRISGENALDIASKIFISKSNFDIKKMKDFYKENELEVFHNWLEKNIQNKGEKSMNKLEFNIYLKKIENFIEKIENNWVKEIVVYTLLGLGIFFFIMQL